MTGAAREKTSKRKSGATLGTPRRSNLLAYIARRAQAKACAETLFHMCEAVRPGPGLVSIPSGMKHARIQLSFIHRLHESSGPGIAVVCVPDCLEGSDAVEHPVATDGGFCET